MIQLKTFFATN